MILLLCTVLFCIPFVCASLSGLNDTCHDSPSYNTRTLWDILSSCGLTLFACTWTAVHPDISYMDQRVIANTLRRLFLMAVVSIAPEFMIYWAICQFLSARFVLYVDGEPRATLEPEELLRFVRDRSVDMPVITEADIQDRSKGDVLSKYVAILQLVWFFIQVIARYAQNLPVTPLEIDTLGVTTLACISYGSWLKKLKDVGRPYIVHWKSEPTAPPPNKKLDDKY
ncbi:hypothetical protein BDR04DRAFT_1129340 [Suillus decipiens]|nr:hypothetical protein BDR04DRAFT_1129340 [Suillus decipiens]